jgi:hypothetical protein
MNPAGYGVLGIPDQVVFVEIKNSTDIVPAELETFAIRPISFLGTEGHAEVTGDQDLGGMEPHLGVRFKVRARFPKAMDHQVTLGSSI